MGANAQTSVPTFTAGEILTAANMNISARTGIPVFADATARNAAFGGTGEKTLAEGQFAYLEDSNTTQYYDGAAWQSVGASSGLSLITTSTFSAVTSVSVNNCFTSTYQNYLININVTSIAVTGSLSMRMRVGGSDNSSANYYWAGSYINFTGSPVINSENSSGLATSFLAGFSPTFGTAFQIDVFSPQETVRTGIFNRINNTDTNVGASYGGNTSVTTAYDGFTVFAGSNIAGTLRVYGYANS